jgi:inner membrane protein
VDNLTHTLIGLAAGEAVARWTPARACGVDAGTRRTALLAVGMVGGNLPDADLLWSMQFVTGDPLAYLVEHRGYTHTLVGCVVLALLLFLGTVATLGWRGQRIRPADVRLFAATSLVAVLLHLGMDALNEYGVHPFWPWNNRWYYGDTLFIVEPLCWLAIAPLYFSLRTRAARALMGLVLAVGCIAALAFHGFRLEWWSLPVLTWVLILGGRRMSPRMASLAVAGLLMLVVGVFSVSHAVAARRVQVLAAGQFVGASLLDIVLSPAPAHPFCWDVMLLQREDKDYVARIGQLSLTSDSGQACSLSLKAGGTAPLRIMNRPVSAGVAWKGEYTMDIQTLSRLAASNCDTRRLASFMRAPFAARSEKGWIIGDLRYDREPGSGFAEMLVDPMASAQCVKDSPWTPPRSDLWMH